jgi:L-amino acid N-acyltransferase YncA
MKDQKYKIRNAISADAAEIAQIYNHYITETIITFEEETVSIDIIEKRIKEIQSLQLPWYVAEQDGIVLGYAYAGKWKERSAYRYSMEVTVYLRPDQAGKGVGSALYGKLLPVLAAKGIHVAVGVIALPNEGSVKLHEKMGFRKAAQFNEVGFKFNRWIDVGCWQRML